MNRLTRRQKLVIGGCAFTALVLGLTLGPCHVQAATLEIAVSSAASDYTTGSSEISWAASDGDLAGLPPLGTGQEVLTGGHRDHVLVSGPTRYAHQDEVNNSEIIRFTSSRDLDASGPGVYEESAWVDSCGSAASGVNCASSGELDQDGANFTATPYCEQVVTTSSFMTDRLTYRSSGAIVQADSDIPDSLKYASDETGNGSGMFRAVGFTRAGIGSTNDLGYVNGINERRGVGGRFRLGSTVRWTSFKKTFDAASG
jgi:hypothetical protein